MFLRAALLLCLGVAFASAQDTNEKTIKYLQSLRLDNGGYSDDLGDGKAPRAATLRATSSAVRSLKYLGKPLSEIEAKKTAEFVRQCYHKDGYFSNVPGGDADIAVTAVGLMAVAALEMKMDLEKVEKYLLTDAKNFEERRLAVAGFESTGKFPVAIDTWLAELRKSANQDGTFGTGAGQARQTGSVVATIYRTKATLPDEQRQACLTAMQKGQRADGGFGTDKADTSDLETCYRVMRAFYLLKEKPKDVKKLLAFMEQCRNADGGYGIAPGAPSKVGPTYFATSIQHWLK